MSVSYIQNNENNGDTDCGNGNCQKLNSTPEVSQQMDDCNVKTAKDTKNRIALPMGNCEVKNDSCAQNKSTSPMNNYDVKIAPNIQYDIALPMGNCDVQIDPGAQNKSTSTMNNCDVKIAQNVQNRKASLQNNCEVKIDRGVQNGIASALKIGEITLKNNLLMAPLAGFTDVGFRALCMRYGAGLAFTEMVSLKGLFYGNENTEDLLTVHPSELTPAVQVFGSDPSVVEKVMRLPVMKRFKIIDLNCGCPVPKIVKNGDGSAMMRDPDQVYKMVRELKRLSNGQAITVKTRKGFWNDEETGILVAKATESAGGDAVTIHGRSREQYYSGTADYEFIAKVKRAVSIPVIGNGDVSDRATCFRMLQTGADGVMIGRAALGNPKIFSEILGLEHSFSRKECLVFHINALRETLPDHVVCSVMKKQFAFYLKGLSGVKQLKEKVFSASDASQLLMLTDSIPEN